MLYFSNFKLAIIYLTILFLSIFSILNFIDINDNKFFSKKINLGLDLQGGSYLLLEVDSKPLIERNLQNKLIILRKSLKNINIKYRDLQIENDVIKFKISENDVEKFDTFFLD